MIFKRMIAALCAGAAALCFASSACADIEYREEEVAVPPRMLFLGDSIATGYGLEGYSGGRAAVSSYANILRDAYTAELPEDCGFEMENLAVDGLTSEQLLSELVKGAYDDKLDVDVIVISIGGNDLLHVLLSLLSDAGINSSEGISAGSLLKLIQAVAGLSGNLDEKLTLFDGNIKNIAEYLRTRTEAMIIVQTLYNPFEGFSLVPGLESLATEKIGRLDELIVQNSEGGTVYNVCDVVPAFAGRATELTNIQSYDIHPNAAGHQVLSECVDKTVRAFKYSYMKAYEVEPAAAEADGDDEGSGADSGSKKSVKDDSDSTTGYIIVAAVGGVLLAAVIITAVVVYTKKNKRRGTAVTPLPEEEAPMLTDTEERAEAPVVPEAPEAAEIPEAEPIVPASVIPEPEES